jgi:hypothetical protein
MDQQTQQQWAEWAVQAVNTMFPAVSFLVEQRKLMLLGAASLLYRVGMYLYERGRYSEAELVFTRVLAIVE